MCWFGVLVLLSCGEFWGVLGCFRFFWFGGFRGVLFVFGALGFGGLGGVVL